MSGPPRVYIDSQNINDVAVRFGAEELRHIRTVLRLRPGDTLLATDGTGIEYHLRLVSSPRGLQGVIEEKRRPESESPLDLTLVQAVPKKELMDFIVQKAVELGVAGIRPVVSRRTIVHLTGDRGRAKQERWRRKAAAALAQSGRTRMPVLGELCSWNEFLAEESRAEMKILLCGSGGDPLAELTRRRKRPSSVLIAVGPEGGWAPEEVTAAGKAGFSRGALGPRILRTESAGLAALSILQFLFGDLGGRKPASRDSGKDDEDL